MQIDPYILGFSLVTVVTTIVVGFWSAKKSKTASDFFVAGRSVSVGWNASAISGEYLSAASFMGIAGMVMKNGYDALWYPVCYACGYLFLLLFIAGPLRRFGAYTIPDFAEGRYDSPVFRKIAVIFVLFIGFFYTMPQMKGAGTTLAYIFPGLDYRWGVLLVGAVITLNVALGGMKGITLVQAFQYWMKMFAISVPIFVLMAVYGSYGHQIKLNEGSYPGETVSQRYHSLEELDFAFPYIFGSRVKPQRLTLPIKDTFSSGIKLMTGQSTWTSIKDSLGLNPVQATNVDIRMLLPTFAAVEKSEVALGNGFHGLPPGAFDPTRFKTKASLAAAIREIFHTNGVEVLRLNGTQVILLGKREFERVSKASAEMSAGLAPRKDANSRLGDVAEQKALTNKPFGTNNSFSDASLSLASSDKTTRANSSFVSGGNPDVEIKPAWPTRDLSYLTDAELEQRTKRLSGQLVNAFAARKPLPEKAPADAAWLSPFGPLTTKAAIAANASPRWRIDAETRKKVVNIGGYSPQQMESGMAEGAIDKVKSIYERLTSRKKKQERVSDFADWTNMPPDTGQMTQMPAFWILEELGLLLDKPVLVATNLPRAWIKVEGSFHSRDQLLKYLDGFLLTNGVHVDLNGPVIKAVAVADWDRYQKDPTGVPLFPDETYNLSMSNAPVRAIVTDYARLLGKQEWFARDLPQTNVNMNVDFLEGKIMLAHEAKREEERILADAGVTIIPATSHDIWAVPTSKLAEYRLPPVDVRPYSLLYTYSLIIALVCGTAGLPHILVRFYTNPDGVAAKRTTMWVMILIGIFYVFPPVFGVLGRNLLPELYSAVGAKGTDKVVLELPSLLNAKYPGLGSVLSGITCAGAFAAFMSTFSGLLVSMTGALAHDVYGRILRPKSTAEQRLRAFKICAVIIGAVAILLGMQVEKLDINFMVGQAFAIAAASYFPLLFLSVWWRGMTIKGAACGMLGGGLLALAGISLTSFSDLKLIHCDAFWAAHPLCRILCEQPAIWAVPLAVGLMIVVSKLTRKSIPADVRMKMLVLHAPEKLGLKQEYIQEHPGH